MTASDYEARIRALEQLVGELRAILRALDQRLTAAEQSLQGRWTSVTDS